MEQVKQPITLKQAAMIATQQLSEAKGDSYNDSCFAEGYYKGFEAGGQWQKEQDKMLMKLLDIVLKEYGMIIEPGLKGEIVDEIKKYHS